MTITYLAAKIIEGLSSDTKPTNVQDGTIFIETNTGDIYIIASGTWSLLNSAGSGGSTFVTPASGYTYTLYRLAGGGTIYARNNKTGVITSNANLDPLITTILASGDPSFEVMPGFYDLSSGFSGWNAVIKMEAFFHGDAIVNVPNGYTGIVWKFNPTDAVIYRASLQGGLWDEQGTPANNWTFLQIAPISTNPPTTTGAVYDCRFTNIKVWRCGKVIHFNTTNKSWANQNYFENIYSEGFKYLFYAEHTGTYTVNQSGIQENLFIDVSGQATPASTGYPQALGGFIGIFGQRNMFISCKPWDMQAANAASSTATITTNASDNVIIGGLLTSYQFSDTSTGGQTIINDPFQGLKQTRAELVYNADYLLKLYRPSSTTFDAVGIQFDQKSSTGVRKTFGTLAVFDDVRTNGAEYTWLGATYLQNGVSAVRGAFYANGIFFGPSNGTRAILYSSGISGGNKEFTFPNLSGEILTTNATQTETGKTINPTNNIMPFLNNFTYTIYQDGGAVKCRNNKTGAITSNANIDPLITTILASGDPVVEIQTGNYNLRSDFSGWNMVTDAHIFMHRGVWLFVPNAYAGDVFKFSPSAGDIFAAKITGGSVIETATATNDWNFIAIKPTNGWGVVMCEVRNTQVWRAKRVIHVNTTGLSWGSDNVFENIEAEACEIFAEFAHTGTWTVDASGLHGNSFNHCFLQATTAAVAGNPLVQGGIINIMGDGNIFTNCNMWDFWQNASAPTATIHANSRGTQIIGGMLTHQLFTDAGTLTKRSDRLSGTVHGGTATFLDDFEIQKDATGPMSIYRPSTTNFLDWGIKFDAKNASGTRVTFSRLFSSQDSNTAGSETGWMGVEYYINGVNGLRGMFYNDGVYFGRASASARVGLLNTGISGGNKTFTFPNVSGQLLTDSGPITVAKGQAEQLYTIYIDSSDSKFKAVNHDTGVITDSGSTTDVLSLFNTVIAAASTAKRPVKMGKGKFPFSAAPTIANKWIFIEGTRAGHSGGSQGDYTSETVLKKGYTDATNPFLNWSNVSGWTQQHWKNIYIEGKDSTDNGAGTFDNGGIGFFIGGTGTAISEIYDVFENVSIAHFSTGLKLAKVWQLHFHELSIYKCGSKGIHLTDDGTTPNSKCFNNIFWGGEVRFAPTNVHLEHSNQAIFNGTMLEGDSAAPYTLVNSVKMDTDATNNRFLACSFENNVNAITLITDAGAGNTVEHGRFGGLVWTAQTIYDITGTKGNFNFNTIEPYANSGIATILLSSGSKHVNVIGNHVAESATGTGLVITDNSGNSLTNLRFGNSSGSSALDNVMGRATTFLSMPTVQVPAANDTVLTLYRPTTTVFSSSVINLDQQSSTGARKTFGKIFVTDDDRTNGAEYTWLGFEYLWGGVSDVRGMFYNNGVYFGTSSNSSRVGIINTGISGSNKTFTLPNLNGRLLASTSSLQTADVVKTANYTLTALDSIVRCDPSTGGASFTITLPTAVGVAGQIYTILRVDNDTTKTVTIATTSSQTIGGVATWYIREQNRYLIVESDGANWKVIGFEPPSLQGTFRKGTTPDRTYIAGLSPYSNTPLVTSTTGPTVNTLYAMPFMVSEITKFDTIRCQVTTLGSGSNLRMGIYLDDGTMYPGKLLFDSGNISAASTGVKPSTITASLQTFQPGLYWLTYENSATVPQIKALPGAGSVWYFAGADNSIANPGGFAYSVAHTVGALPDPYTSGATLITTASAVGTPVPAVGLRPIT